MDLFDEKEIFKDKIEDYRTINIPDNLSWDKMGPAILEGIKKRKKRRRLLIWWWSMSLAFIGFSLIGWWFSNQSIPSNIPTIEFQKEIISPEEKNKIYKEKIKRREEPLLSQEKIAANKNLEIEELDSPTKRERTSIKSSSDLLTTVDTFVAVPTQLQNNKEGQFKDIQAKEKNYIKSRPTIVTERLPILYSPLSYKTMDVIFPTTPKIKKTFSSKWQIEMGGGINWWMEGLIANRAIEPINTTYVGWQVNARVNRYLTKFLTIKLGLQFQNLRYKSAFEHTKEIAIYQPNTADVIFINSLTGKRSISYRDSIPGLQTRKFQNFNQHHTFQIPFLAGFTIGKKRWKYSFHTGLSLQFFQHSKGRISLVKGTVVDLPNKNVYPTTFKLNYLLETQLTYQVTNKLSIFNRWSMERHLTNWLSLESEFQQRPKIGYSSFGLAWSF